MLIIIPARMGSQRLPNKPMAEIDGLPMVIQVANRAREANCGEVVIACSEEVVANEAKKHGFKAVMTDPNLPTGTDRVWAAYEALGRPSDVLINLQGDMPFISPETVRAVAEATKERKFDVCTAASKFEDISDIEKHSAVKVALTYQGRALYFSRTPSFPYGNGDYLHHIGIYGYKADALEQFVQLPQSPLEIRENLEQLRALENDISIGVALVNDSPKSVDTAEDLECVRQYAAKL